MRIILSKLRVFGVQEAPLRLIESYLTGRITVCMVGSATLSKTKLESGIGEGSVVGPLFFIATFWDITIVAEDVMELLHVLHGLSVMVHLLAYADDISAVIIADTK